MIAILHICMPSREELLQDQLARTREWASVDGLKARLPATRVLPSQSRLRRASFWPFCRSVDSPDQQPSLQPLPWSRRHGGSAARNSGCPTFAATCGIQRG